MDDVNLILKTYCYLTLIFLISTIYACQSLLSTFSSSFFFNVNKTSILRLNVYLMDTMFT